jgi:hypothetical protein
MRRDNPRLESLLQFEYEPDTSSDMDQQPLLRFLHLRLIRICICIFPLLLIVTSFAQRPNDPASMPTPQQISESVTRFFSPSEYFPIELVEQIPIVDARIPFLSSELVGKSAIKVTVGPGKLRLKSQAKDFGDLYTRRFVILLNADASKLLSITSAFQGQPTKDIVAEPSTVSAERQLRKEREIYESLPSENPHIDFLEALDQVLTNGIGSPLVAKEIDALYVMRSKNGAPPQPVWIIMMRGLPPLPRLNDGQDWKRTRIRNIVNAASGKWIGATTIPLPDE